MSSDVFEGGLIQRLNLMKVKIC